MRRDNTIDLFRGIAALSIVIIHTAFWSGSSYVPPIIQSLTLLIDVPLFMFISGMTYNFSNSLQKNIKGLITIWKKYLIFLIPYFIISYVMDPSYLSLKEIINSIFFSSSVESPLQVVPGSLWFIFMFFTVSLISSIIITIYNKYNDNLDNFKNIILVSFILYGMSVYNKEFIFLNTCNLLYIFIYLLGYYLYNKKFKTIWDYLFVLFFNIDILLFILLFGEYGITNIQGAKFDYSITYLLWSSISITTVAYLKDRIKFNCKFLNWIGKNAIIFYFGQGISSSLIGYAIKNITLSYLPKFIIACIINLILSILISFVLLRYINLIENLLKKNKFKILIVDKES